MSEAKPTETIDIKDLGLEWLECAPFSWDVRVSQILEQGTVSVRELADWLDSISIRCARLSGYLDARGALGCGDNGHSDGVKLSNRKATKVRRALGYTFPKYDINF